MHLINVCIVRFILFSSVCVCVCVCLYLGLSQGCTSKIICSFFSSFENTISYQTEPRRVFFFFSFFASLKIFFFLFLHCEHHVYCHLCVYTNIFFCVRVCFVFFLKIRRILKEKGSFNSYNQMLDLYKSNECRIN